MEQTFGYNLNKTIYEIRPNYAFDVSCQGSVPEAIIAFLEGNSFEEVIRLAISIGVILILSAVWQVLLLHAGILYLMTLLKNVMAI